MLYGFDNEKYLKIQSEHIKERISRFGNKLYLEFGGKLFDDNHAARVLPGFRPDSKLHMLLQLRDEAEIVIVISLGITYDEDVLRLRDAFIQRGLLVNSVVITHFRGQEGAKAYRHRLEQLGIRTYYHYTIDDYPNNVALIDSDEGFGKNDYIETTRPLVIVTAPGPGSGKMAVCLSQLYQDNKRGIKAGYAKFETFPVWNLPLKHPVNLAYEAATADLNDLNMIDPFHLDAYGVKAVNYNRDIEIFPVLNAIFEGIYGENPYKSPTDMGVNMVGNCIIDDEICCQAAKDEIIRRYYATLNSLVEGKADESEVSKIALIMQQLKITTDDRKVTVAAKQRQQESGKASAAIELKDGTIITAESSPLLGPSAALLLNATKLISPRMIEPIQNMKVHYLHGHNPRLHTDEVLVAISILSTRNENCRRALAMLPELEGCQVHTTVMLSDVDRRIFKKLGCGLTCDPVAKASDPIL